MDNDSLEHRVTRTGAMRFAVVSARRTIAPGLRIDHGTTFGRRDFHCRELLVACQMGHAFGRWCDQGPG